MTHCEKCHRLRTPTGLHICLEKALSSRSSVTNVNAKQEVTAGTPRRINTITLPGNGPAAQVWNALIEGRRRGLVG